MTKLYLFVRHAIYSDISQHKKRPSFFSRENCYQNLLRTKPKSAKLTFFLDTYHGKLEDHFLSQEKKYPVITKSLGSETASFLFLLDWVEQLQCPYDSIIYLVEDDYLHRENWGKVLEDGFSHSEIDYLTLYDHNDKYDKSLYPNLTAQIIGGRFCHFRSTPSTTNTFAARAKTLKEDIAVHRAFSEGRKITEDHQKFLALGQRGRTIYSAIPGWSTHMEKGLESPYIDWKEVAKLPNKSKWKIF